MPRSTGCRSDQDCRTMKVPHVTERPGGREGRRSEARMTPVPFTRTRPKLLFPPARQTTAEEANRDLYRCPKYGQRAG
jgi:hypothetical protein